MLRHTFLLIYRNFKRFKSTFFINLIGLSTGLTCALLIYLWVSDELSIDKFHEKDSRLYQILEHHDRADKINTIENTAGLLAESLAEELPEVEYAVAVTPASWFESFTLSMKEDKIKARGQFVGKDFFNTFSYNLMQGEKSQVLSNKNAIVVSESLALQLFNTTEGVVGKTLEWNLLQFSQPVIVTGVFEGTPSNSSSQFDFLLSYEAFKEINPSILSWGNMNVQTFLVLQEGADITHFNKKIEGYISSKVDYNEFRTLHARPYSEGYLYGSYENGRQNGGRIAYVRLFSIIALFIVFIACINFMNLSTAKASRRIKEVGVKKAIGADRSTLIFHYLTESLLMAFISLLVALVLVSLLLPHFNNITGKDLSFDLTMPLILVLCGITILTGLVAGSYPALYLSGFNPMVVLKGKLNSSLGELWTRKGLVVFQFALSVILIVSVLIIYKQIAFAQNKNLGYNKNNVITIPLEGKAAERAATFLTELKRIPGVETAASLQGNIVGIQSFTTGLNWTGKNPEDVVNFTNFTAGYGAIETFGLEITDGRRFSPEFSSDSSAIIFNETAIALMGLKDPIGETVNLWGKDRKIIGIVKDFHFESMHEPVKPLFIKVDNENMMTVAVRVEAGKVRETLLQLEAFYKSFNPGYSFDYKFVDADYQSLYQAELRVSSLSKYFAGLAILISCLGLFGLAAFTAERRLKEIGIRKILGSSEFEIVYLLSSDFTKIVIISLAIALPMSYIMAKKWLESFAYRIDLEWWYFVGAGFIALFIAWFTVGLQTVKAARVNPASCLKDE